MLGIDSAVLAALVCVIIAYICWPSTTMRLVRVQSPSRVLHSAPRANNNCSVLLSYSVSIISRRVVV